MSQRLGVNYGYIQGYRNSTIFDRVSLDIAASINPNTSIKNKLMMEKTLTNNEDVQFYPKDAELLCSSAL